MPDGNSTENDGQSTGGTGDGGQQDQQDGQQQGGTGGTGTSAVVDENTPVDVSTLPPNVQKLIRQARDEAANNRTAKNQVEQEKQATLEAIAKALGISKEGEAPDPAKLAEQLADRDSKLRETLAQNAVLRNAGAAKGDPEALLDSNSFMSKLAKLDPSEDGYDGKVKEAMRDAIAKNPRLAAGTPVTAGGREINGGGNNDGSEPDYAALAKKARTGR